MIRMLGLVAGLAVSLLASESGAIDAPPDAIDLRAGLEPLTVQFDAERGRHRLLVLLSPA